MAGNGASTKSSSSSSSSKNSSRDKKDKNRTSLSRPSPALTRGRAASTTDSMCAGASEIANVNDIISSALAAFELKMKKSIDASLAAHTKSLEIDLLEKIEKMLDEKVALMEKRIMASVDCQLRSNESKYEKLVNDYNNLERRARLDQIVIRGIPRCENAKPMEIVTRIADKIAHNLTPFASARRLPSRSTGIAPVSHPIMVTFSCNDEAKMFLDKFKKSKGLALKDLDLGFMSDSPIYANEYLSHVNASILRAAVRAKKEQKLFSTLSKDGLVRVKVHAQDKYTTIYNMAQLINLLTGSRSADAITSVDCSKSGI